MVDEAFDDLYDPTAPMDPANPTDAGDYVRRFWYDLVGNRMVQQVDRAGTANDEATLAKYDANDRQLTEWSQGATSLEVGSQEWYLNTSFNQTAFFQYDNGDGNADNFDGTTLTAKRVYSGQWNSTQEPNASTATSETTYEYNVQGRLGKVTTDDGTTVTEYEYLYDTTGTRVRQTVTVDGGAPTVTQYLVDSNNPTGYSQVLEEKDGAGTITKTYVLGHDVLLQAASAAAYHWLVYDGHGSTRALLDEGAALVQNGGANQLFAYTPHGELIDLSGYIGSVGDALTSLLYSGEQTDGNGQQYLRARYYNPATGTFNRLDPFAGIFDDPQSLHKYTYTANDPVNRIDPSGEIWGFLAKVGFGALVGAGFAAADVWLDGGDRDQILAAAWQGGVIGASLALGVGGIGKAFGKTAQNFAIAGLATVGVGLGGYATYDSAQRGNYKQAALRGIGTLGAAIAARQALINGLAGVRPNVIIKPDKWKFFFGKVKSSPHNEARSLQNVKDLATLGFEDTPAGRAGLTKLFEIGRHLPQTESRTTEFGVTITRRVPAGSAGAIDVKYFYPNGNLSVKPQISSIIPKIFTQ